MNRQKFLKSLASLSGWRESAFLLALAERALPSLQLYLEASNGLSDMQVETQACEKVHPNHAGVGVFLNTLMDASWASAIIQPDEEGVIQILDDISALQSVLIEESNYGALPSLDCCQNWEQALLSVLNQDKKRAQDGSQRALNSVTGFIEFSEGEGLSENALVKLFESHPLVEREFSFQAELDELLRQARNPGSSFIEELRILAQDEGVSSIGISLQE